MKHENTGIAPSNTRTGPKDESIGGLWARDVAALSYLVPILGPVFYLLEDNTHVRFHGIHGFLFALVAPVAAYASHVGGLYLGNTVSPPGGVVANTAWALFGTVLVFGVPIAIACLGAWLVYKAKVGDMYALPVLRWIVWWLV